MKLDQLVKIKQLQFSMILKIISKYKRGFSFLSFVASDFINITDLWYCISIKKSQSINGKIRYMFISYFNRIHEKKKKHTTINHDKICTIPPPVALFYWNMNSQQIKQKHSIH